LNRIGILVATLGFILFAGPSHAEDRSTARPAFDYHVQIIRDGAVIDTVHIPQGSTIEVTGARTIGNDRTGITTFTGDASLVAIIGGQQVMTLQGDQLILTRTPIEK
jgi:hypothetical protein